jgi:hypothetical protein
MAARLPPKNIIPVFNPAEFSRLAVIDTSTELPVDIAQQVTDVENDTDDISAYVANYAFAYNDSVFVGRANLACMTSYTSTGQTFTLATWTRSSGIYLYRVGLNFVTSQPTGLSFIEIQFVENNSVTQYANWCQPYFYGGQGTQVNQFRNVFMNAIFATNIPLGTSKTLNIKCRASITNTNVGTYTVGTNALAGVQGSYEGTNLIEMKIGNGSNL